MYSLLISVYLTVIALAAPQTRRTLNARHDGATPGKPSEYDSNADRNLENIAGTFSLFPHLEDDGITKLENAPKIPRTGCALNNSPHTKQPQTTLPIDDPGCKGLSCIFNIHGLTSPNLGDPIITDTIPGMSCSPGYKDCYCCDFSHHCTAYNWDCPGNEPKDQLSALDCLLCRDNHQSTDECYDYIIPRIRSGHLPQ